MKFIIPVIACLFFGWLSLAAGKKKSDLEYEHQLLVDEYAEKKDLFDALKSDTEKKQQEINFHEKSLIETKTEAEVLSKKILNFAYEN
ncbi:MAG: hypothetical protein QF858_00070 [Candidatus Pacebacteria bacterium]|nr:hypothetical protein [Candidatus Paceibacterota bacterium]